MKTYRFNEIINKHGQYIAYFSSQPGNTDLERLERTFSDRIDRKMSDSRTFGKGFLIGTAYYDNIFPQIQMMKPGIRMSFETEDVFVWEMEDQYFLVIILPFEGEKSVLFPPRRASYKNATFWKCDQIEGIERLISDSIENN